MQPKYPLYIVSKGRYESRVTARHLDAMKVPYFIVVEPQELALYAEHIPATRLLTLDPSFKERYELCDDLGLSQPTGSGPARNFAWEHSISQGHERHWVMDDNIHGFYRLNRNTRIRVYDGAFFRAMEDFCDRYTNVVMAGPHYRFFAPSKSKRPPFILNTRVFSCNLIRNDIKQRWRGRYNEDAILSLDILKAGYCTIQFFAFLQGKAATQTTKGGNTTELYGKGTEKKSEMLKRVHPDVTTLTMKYGRAHHHVDFRSFKRNKLVRKIDADVTPGVNEYGLVLKKRSS